MRDVHTLKLVSNVDTAYNFYCIFHFTIRLSSTFTNLHQKIGHFMSENTTKQNL